MASAAGNHVHFCNLWMLFLTDLLWTACLRTFIVFCLISMDDINPTNFSRPSVTNLSSGLFCRGSNSFLYWYIQERNTMWKKNCGCIRLVADKIQIVFCRDLDGNHVTRFIQWGCVVVVRCKQNLLHH